MRAPIICAAVFASALSLVSASTAEQAKSPAPSSIKVTNSPAKPADSAKAPMKRDTVKAAGKPGYSSTAVVIPAVEEKPAPGACSVAKMVFAPKVENYEPVGEAAELPASSGKIYCWTRLSCGGAPMKVKHVWTMDGKKICEIPLSLKSGIGRSASAKTIVPGKWKVEVVRESGEVIGSGEVTVK